MKLGTSKASGVLNINAHQSSDSEGDNNFSDDNMESRRQPVTVDVQKEVSGILGYGMSSG